MTEKRVRLNYEPDRARLILNRDPVNALSTEMVDDLRAWLKSLESRDDYLILTVESSREKAFSAGADLKQRKSMEPPEVRSFLRQYRQALEQLSELPVPVVAIIEAPALGGGLELALACDFRWATPEAEFALPETRLGLIPGAGGTQRLPRLIGQTRAKQMILLGERIGAEKALDWGLVDTIVTEPEERVTKWIKQLRKGSQPARALAKCAIDRGKSRSLSSGLRLEWDQYLRTFQHFDREEALEKLRAES